LSSSSTNKNQAPFWAWEVLNKKLLKNGRIMMDNRLVLKSAQPLDNALLKWRRLYWLGLLFIIIGIVVRVFWGIAILYLAVCYTVNYCIIQWKWMGLRDIKFKFIPNVPYDDLFNRLQPALLSKYGSGFMIERGSDGRITITYDGLIYDIILEEDYFKIGWRMSVGKAFLSIREYKYYRKCLIAMGMIGYEAQRAYAIE
jgi:hypothetical protein